MDRNVYRQNGEQRFPYILPVLRSYKQSVMFESITDEALDFSLPEIDSKFLQGFSSSFSKKKKKKKIRKKKPNSSMYKNPIPMKYSPHFNINFHHSYK